MGSPYTSAPAPPLGGSDLPGEEHENRPDGRNGVYGFYHLCTINTWRSVLDEQIEALASSGLAGATRHVFASVVGPHHDDGVAVLVRALGERVEIVHQSPDASLFERPALEFCRRFCAEIEPWAAAVWYLHSKGVSPQRCTNPNVADWRRLMQHFVVERWQDCLSAVREYDVCGVNWLEEPSPHFSGNFWWASPRYIAGLADSIGVDRLAPELWIGSREPNVCCLHQSGVNHYLAPYPADAYS